MLVPDYRRRLPGHRFIRVLVLSAAIVLLAAGCGSGEAVTTGKALRSERAARVERVSFEPRPDGMGIVTRLHIDNPVPAIGELAWPAPNVVTFVIEGTGLHYRYRTDRAEAPVRSYRLTESTRGIEVRMTFDRDDVDASVRRDPASNDLLLAVGITTGGIANRIAAAIQASDRRGPDVRGTAAAEERDAPVENPVGRWKLDTIVIDAGHGGDDEGAVGYGGVLEKDIVLPVAKKVGRAIEERLGLDVVFTRTDDRFIPLNQRGHIANEAGGKLFISIHTNAAPDRRARGSETYFLGMHKTEAARTVMERENQVIELENDPGRYDDFDQSALITQVLAQSAYMHHSQMLASIIQSEFDRRPDNRNRGVKQAGFYVLWSASMPAVLVELGFLTNPAESAYMRSEDGQDELALSIVRAVETFRSRYATSIGSSRGVANANGRE